MNALQLTDLAHHDRAAATTMRLAILSSRPTSTCRRPARTVVILLAWLGLIIVVSPASSRAALSTATVSTRIDSLKLIDYFPASNGWTNMWTHWSASQQASDFARIASMHANAVRIIVPANTFGFPTPSPAMMAELKQTISLASTAGLRSELTLFDGWNNYLDVPDSRTWASAVLAPFRGDPRIGYIDIHNELPADTNPASLSWAQAMVPFVQQIDGDIPVAVSTSISSGLAPLRALVAGLSATPADLYDVHYYGKIDHAYDVLSQAKQVAGGIPVFVGETGFATDSSYPWTSGIATDAADLEQYQRYYLQMVEYATQALHMPPAAPWILYDFNPGAMNPGSIMPAYEYHFGLIRTDGTMKPAGSFISQLFATGVVDTTFNNNFQIDAPSTNLPALWKLWEPAEASFSTDTTDGYGGVRAARVDDAAGDSSGCPGFYSYPITAVVPGESYSAAARVRGTGVAGTTRVVLAWFARDDSFISNDESASLPSGATPWTQLSVSAVAPSGAVAIELHLQSCQNPGTVWWDDVSFQSPAGQIALGTTAGGPAGGADPAGSPGTGSRTGTGSIGSTTSLAGGAEPTAGTSITASSAGAVTAGAGAPVSAPHPPSRTGASTGSAVPEGTSRRRTKAHAPARIARTHRRARSATAATQRTAHPRCSAPGHACQTRRRQLSPFRRR